MTFSTLLRISFQGLLARRVNLLLGALVAAATIVLMLAAAVLITVSTSINSAIIECCIGHVVVWSPDNSPKVPEPLNLVPEQGDFPKLGQLPDYHQLEQELEAIPGVRVALPLSLLDVDFHSHNLVDQLVEEARGLFEAQSPENQARRQDLVAHLRFIVEAVKGNLAKAAAVSDPRLLAADMAAMEQAASPEFWDSFESDPLQHLDFLEAKVAPQLDASSMEEISFIMAGTDIPEYQAGVPRARVVMGDWVPVGKRGVMINALYYEDYMKHPVAVRLDQLAQAAHDGDTLAEDADQQQRVSEIKGFAGRIILELGPRKGEAVRQKLGAALGQPEQPLPALLETLFTLDDANLAERSKLFYQEVAPHIALYLAKVGEEMVLKVTGTDGYTRSIRSKLYGIISFEGAERSFFADVSLMDLASFGELYGTSTPELQAELAQMRASVEVDADLSAEELRKELEASLLSGEDTIQEVQAVAFEAPAPRQQRRVLSDTFDPVQVRNTSVVASSLRLYPDADLGAVISAVEKLGKQRGHRLGAVPWDVAMGFLKVFPDIVLFVLYCAAGLVLLAVTLTLTHSVMTTTFQRTQELGTLRALGAQASFVMGLVLVELLMVTALAVAVGMLIAGPAIWYLNGVGISSEGSMFLRVLFGDRLYPTLAPAHAGVLALALLAITALSALWPSIHALRIPAVRAMQSEE